MKDISLIIEPRITEKSVDMNTLGKYVFMVKPSATKNEIKKAFKDHFKVDVVSVNIVNLPGKTRKYRGREYNDGAVKKAIITLKEGQKIDLAR